MMSFKMEFRIAHRLHLADVISGSFPGFANKNISFRKSSRNQYWHKLSRLQHRKTFCFFVLSCEWQHALIWLRLHNPPQKTRCALLVLSCTREKNQRALIEGQQDMAFAAGWGNYCCSPAALRRTPASTFTIGYRQPRRKLLLNIWSFMVSQETSRLS